MPTFGPQVFWIDEHVVTDPAGATAQALLADAWQRRERVLCVCRVPAPAMYVAAVGSRYLVKRMPGTRQEHHRDCPSYQPYLTPFAGVDDTDPERMVLRVALPDGRPDTRRRPPRRPRGETGGAGRLDLTALLAYLWHEAGLDAWSSKMEGKRHWGVVSWHLREAAHGKTLGVRPLSEQLYVPAPFRSERRHEHAQDRAAAWEKARRDERLLLVVGEAKVIEAATYGHRLRVKHLLDAPIYLDEQMHARLFREHLAAVELIENDTTGHPMVIAAVRITAKGHARAREVALLKTTREWLPYRAGLERRILADAVEDRRRFTVTCCRPESADRRVPSLVLTDTAQPVAVFHLSPPDRLADGIRQWVWEPGKPWPDAASPGPREIARAPTPPTNPKEQVTHG
jgi:hypothetical protein